MFFYSGFISRVLAGALTKIVHILVNVQTPPLGDGISTDLFGFALNLSVLMENAVHA